MGLWANLKKQLSNIELQYLGGHPELAGPAKLGVRREGDDLCLCNGAIPLVRIPVSDITGITMDKASKRSAGKAAAGAILGGVLTGGIGAIAGAVIGGRRRDDSIIALDFVYNGMELEAYFQDDNLPAKYGQLIALLKKKVN